MLQRIRNKKKTLLLLICLMMSLTAAGTAFAFGEGAQGPDVYAVQGMLKSLGYYAGNITGYYGPDTASGVRMFQKAHGLRVTGAVDDQTLQSILWAYANLKIPKKPTPAPTPPPAPQPNPVPQEKPTELTAEEQQMLDLVNQARTEAGLSPFAVDLELSKVARLKSQDMVDKNYFSHDSPTYGSPFDMMKKFGIEYRTAGENIACNQNVTAAHQALMNSEGHRANILSKDFTHIGIGIVDGGPCGKMFTQQFIAK
ncbi:MULTISPECIES: CAP domain-containing protein [unclassified Paenibacillus]|uniref:CAP domain-containing protein n=1 Tax=unclassified Paenibacillus TaxID=185978 RepID=UPI001AE9F772|nr:MULTISPECIES: CAP domain-containing protein [unclassified Paenibacillus]MBP1156651.1 putative YkwD family protein [Paenibacillus sp. PvP091]MBP1172611.1 putative YkwD family protein [Paenibacillus sp. PvR098]MBP2438991.1 putative YkwD family protein [Paenibacillus sp. PvP052]